MKKKGIGKILCAGTAVLLAGALCGCSVKFGTNKPFTIGDGKEPRLDLAVAYPTAEGASEDMDITYEMFRKEYAYFLVNKGITNDTDETAADSCKQQRSSIINYLINERIIVSKAKEFGVYELTEEEQAEVEKDFEDNIAKYVKIFGDQAEMELISKNSGGTVQSGAEESETSEPSMTDEEKEEIGNKKLDEMLDKCGMTRDDLRWWSQSSKITEKLRNKLGEAVTMEDAEEALKGVQEEAQRLYKEDMNAYTSGSYDQIWLPDGSRLIKHVLLGFDDDVRQEIYGLRLDGKDADADKKRTEAAEALKSKQEEVEKKLDDGTKIEELIKEYSADKDGSEAYPDGYTVIPNGTTYMEEFQKAAFVPEKIGDRTTCVTDYGVHIMVYAGDAKLSEATVKSFTEYLLTQLRSKEFSDKMSEWFEEYSYEIDYDALRLDDPSAEESSDVSDTAE